MTTRAFNFSAGPGMLPEPVLKASAEALVDYQGSGVGIAEVSHRGKVFDAVLNEAVATCKELLHVPDTHDVLFLQGGATQMFYTVPLNILPDSGPKAEYVVSGQWSNKAYKGAKKSFGDRLTCIASSEGTNYDRAPTGWTASKDAPYLHVCSNETVHGHRLTEWPEHPTLIVDASSEMMSRMHPVERSALIYAGAQKNLGPSGVTLVIVRKDLYARIGSSVPDILSLNGTPPPTAAKTPPTFGVYVLLETFRWLKAQGGLNEMEKKNAAKAALVYNAIDNSGGFYKGTVVNPDQRSHMNVTFTLPNDDLTKAFIEQSGAEGLLALKGYRTVGGIRASIYNAMPHEGCQALADFMNNFAAQNG